MISRASERRSAPRFSATALVVGVACLLSVWPATASEPSGEAIGHALGETVYREQVRAEDASGRHGALHRLFGAPVMQRYRDEHPSELAPTDAELDEARAFFAKQHEKRIGNLRPRLLLELEIVEERLADESLSEAERGRYESQRSAVKGRLDPPDDATARFVVRHWKWQNYLYEQYGGGRVLLQQLGPEAFDAMRVWLEQREQAGNFQITDPELREEFFAYWTTQDHGSFLSDDPERVQMLQSPYWRQGDKAQGDDAQGD